MRVVRQADVRWRPVIPEHVTYFRIRGHGYAIRIMDVSNFGLRPPAPDTRQPTDNPRAHRLRKEIAADPVDVAEREHDISCTVDPGHCAGARYETAARHRSRHRAV